MRGFAIITILVGFGTTASAGPSPEQLHRLGQREYESGNFGAAVVYWRASYRVSEEPGILFNIAQAYRRLDDCMNALPAFRLFVELDPNDPTSEESRRRHDIARGAILELDARCGSAPSTQAALRSRPGANIKLAGLATAGTGTALVVTGLWFGLRASRLGDEVTRACAMSCDWEDVKSKDADGRRAATLGRVLDGVGLVAIAVGASLYIHGKRQEKRALAIQPTGSGASVILSGVW